MRVLVYDADCRICRRWSRRMARWSGLGEGARKPFQEYEGPEAKRLLEAGIRNEMIVVDPGTGETRVGLRGFAWFLRGTRLGWLGAILAFPPVRGLATVLYRLVSHNRRVIAPTPRGVACACDPEPDEDYQWGFIACCLLLAAQGVVVAGLGAAWFVPLARWEDRPYALAFAAASGWLVLQGISLALPPARRVAFLAHSAWAAALGGLATAAVGWVAIGGWLLWHSDVWPVVIVLAPVAGLALTVGLQARRTLYLGLGARWIRAWVAACVAGLFLARLTFAVIRT